MKPKIAVCRNSFPLQTANVAYFQIKIILLEFSAYSDGSPPPINPLNAELNPICHLLALVGVHHILHVSRIRVNPDEWSSVVQRSSGKVPAILLCIIETWIFRTDFQKYWNPIFHEKSVHWEPSCSTRTDGRLDGQTDEDIRKLRVALRSSAKTPKNESESNSTCFYLRVYIRKAIPLLHKSIKFAW